MKKVYLIFSILGTVIPFYIFIPWVIDNGLDINLFISEWMQTRISSFFAADFIISWVVFMIFIFNDNRKKKVKKLWIPIVGNFCIGLSFALPFYLYLRED